MPPKEKKSRKKSPESKAETQSKQATAEAQDGTKEVPIQESKVVTPDEPSKKPIPFDETTSSDNRRVEKQSQPSEQKSTPSRESERTSQEALTQAKSKETTKAEQGKKDTRPFDPFYVESEPRDTQQPYSEYLFNKLDILRKNFIKEQETANVLQKRHAKKKENYLETARRNFFNFKDYFTNSLPLEYDWRELELHRLSQALFDAKDEVLALFEKSFGRKLEQSLLQEYDHALAELEHTKKNFKSWIREEQDAPLTFGNAKTYSLREPYGVVLIAGDWQAPFLSLIKPLISALAGGNHVVLYPNKRFGEMGKILMEAIRANMDLRKVTVIDEEISLEDLFQYHFDFVYGTGDMELCRKISRLASERFIPFAVNLDGVNAAVVDETANIQAAADKIFNARFDNIGQTITSPDFVYVSEKVFNEFLVKIKINVYCAFGEDIKRSPEYGRIADDEQMKLLISIINEEHGGQLETTKIYDEEERYLEPVIITNPKKTSKLVNSMVRGPVLTLISYSSQEEVYNDLLTRNNLTNLYYFTTDLHRRITAINNFKNLNIFINDAGTQEHNIYMPGGASGPFSYSKLNGISGFNTFTTPRSVQEKGSLQILNNLLPPVTQEKLKKLNRYTFLKFTKVRHVKQGGLGLLALWAWNKFA